MNIVNKKNIPNKNITEICSLSFFLNLGLKDTHVRKILKLDLLMVWFILERDVKVLFNSTA